MPAAHCCCPWQRAASIPRGNGDDGDVLDCRRHTAAWELRGSGSQGSGLRLRPWDLLPYAVETTEAQLSVWCCTGMRREGFQTGWEFILSGHLPPGLAAGPLGRKELQGHALSFHFEVTTAGALGLWATSTLLCAVGGRQQLQST